jgi:hypothetical protein
MLALHHHFISIKSFCCKLYISGPVSLAKKKRKEKKSKRDDPSIGSSRPIDGEDR